MRSHQTKIAELEQYCSRLEMQVRECHMQQHDYERTIAECDNYASSLRDILMVSELCMYSILSLIDSSHTLTSYERLG